MGTEREPICGHCWARGVRQVLEFKPDKGYWECPLCLARSITPGPDEEELRRGLEEIAKDYRVSTLPVNTIIARDHWKTVESTRRLRPGSGSRLKKKRKKRVVRKPWFPVDVPKKKQQ